MVLRHKSYYKLLLKAGDRMSRAIHPGKPLRSHWTMRKGK